MRFFALAPTLAFLLAPLSAGAPEASVAVLDGEVARQLEPLPGTPGRAGTLAALAWSDFPGEKADLRVHEARPTFRVAMEGTPKQRLFLVKCQVNPWGRSRSVRMGRAKVPAPEAGEVVLVEVRPEGPGRWRITPTAPLEPGEYGFFSASFHGGPAGLLFDFGVDRSI